jgi:hypothetical protein
MLLASKTIEAGSIGRRIGESLDDNPYPPMSQESQYELIGVPPNQFKVRTDLNWNKLWETGWMIEDYKINKNGKES